MKIIVRHKKNPNRTHECEVSFEKIKGEIVLDAVEAQGFKLSFGCRSGACGVCRVKIEKGLELLEARGFVEEDTFLRCRDETDVRLACQARLAVEGELILDVAPELAPLPED